MQANFNWDRGALERAVREAGDKAVSSRVVSAERAARAVVCPVHHGHPTVTKKKTGDGYEITISRCCCDSLVERATAARDRALRGA